MQLHYANQLHKVWNVELTILDTVDNICRKHGLKYSIAYGTMLGAIRHGGFIPWDDDVDIIMPREDYKKFLMVWKQLHPKGYILQNKYTNWDFTQNFTKIRKDKTTFLQADWEKSVSYHVGIFIDVFPGDRVAPGKITRKFQLMASAINLLISRGHTSNSSSLQKIVENLVLLMPKVVKKYLYKKTEKYIQKWNKHREQDFFYPSTMEWAYRHYPYNMFDEMKDVNFAGHRVMCVKDTDKILTIDYGDYMKLPPVEERVLKHKPIIMDIEHNLDELI